MARRKWTYRQWNYRGRPRTDQEIKRLVLRLARGPGDLIMLVTRGPPRHARLAALLDRAPSQAAHN